MDKGQAYGALKKLWRGYWGALKKVEDARSASAEEKALDKLDDIKAAIIDVSRKGGLKKPRFKDNF